MTYVSLKTKGIRIKGEIKMLIYVTTVGPQLSHKSQDTCPIIQDV